MSARFTDLYVDVLNTALAKGRLDDQLRRARRQRAASAGPVVIVLTGREARARRTALARRDARRSRRSRRLPRSGRQRWSSTAMQLQLLSGYMERIEDVLDSADRSAGSDAAARAQAARRPHRARARRVPLRARAARSCSTTSACASSRASSWPSSAPPAPASPRSRACSRRCTSRSPAQLLFDGIDRAQLGPARAAPPARHGHAGHAPVRRHGARQHRDARPRACRSSASRRAARRAHIHDDITALPMGYDSVLADGGASLSGGQRQRLALARALLHEPPVVRARRGHERARHDHRTARPGGARRRCAARASSSRTA